ncbi:MAG: prepilin-type N-terminal cleavage/methylation domain-containing protein [Verrucomicrobia bacterium]|nr:prepilin-type N-terminal cleavage/methylation domain-containing protein [Verrucomicrobiota bacterium]
MHTHSENPLHFVPACRKCGSFSRGFTLIELLVVIAIIALVGGCTKKTPVQDNDTVAAPPPSATDANASPAVPPQTSSIAPAPGQAAPEPTLQEATEALHVWLMKRPTPPKDLNELVALGFIKKLPTPPPGKKLAIDQRHMAVVFVDSK